MSVPHPGGVLLMSTITITVVLWSAYSRSIHFPFSLCRNFLKFDSSTESSFPPRRRNKQLHKLPRRWLKIPTPTSSVQRSQASRLNLIDKYGHTNDCAGYPTNHWMPMALVFRIYVFDAYEARANKTENPSVLSNLQKVPRC